ncbi:MAG: hypothetical protein IJY95_01250 [Bacteroides sp.]|nr:hypothetical protein [Bacteroides sp.]
MKRVRKLVDDATTYVSSTRKHIGSESSEYVYTVWYDGNAVIDTASAEELQELVSCMQAALKMTEKGGEQ